MDDISIQQKLYSNEKESTIPSCNNINEPQKHNAG